MSTIELKPYFVKGRATNTGPLGTLEKTHCSVVREKKSPFWKGRNIFWVQNQWCKDAVSARRLYFRDTKRQCLSKTEVS